MLNGLRIVWVVFMLVMGPLNALATRRKLAGYAHHRIRAYLGTVLGLLATGAITFVLDVSGHPIGLLALKTTVSLPRLLGWTLGALATCVSVWLTMQLLRQSLHKPPDPAVMALLPRTAGERMGFYGVSLTAGFIEEYVARGFCLGFLTLVTGSVPLAFVITTLGFGLSHLYQGLTGVMNATLLGAILAVPVIVTGALLPSMLAHAGFDMVAGTWMRRLYPSEHT
jgi:membrane protease YdiL (CAAX protease family)